MPRIGAAATMPSRIKTFAQVLPVLAAQLDHVYVFLDGFDEVPDFLKKITNVSIIRSQEAGDYHCSGRFLCLQMLKEPSVVISFDDDIHYPSDYVTRLVAALETYDGRAVVGVHGNIFRPPFTNYLTDRKCLHFRKGLWRTVHCDQVGAGTAAFCSDILTFDIRKWPTHRSDDGYLALEAKAQQIPIVCIPRWRGWLKPFRERQAFSIWKDTNRDHSEKTALMRRLVAERVAAYEARHRVRA